MRSFFGNNIATQSGRYFDYAKPSIDQIDLGDIALALSNTCRFAGHCNFYSVAEHSWHCARLAQRWYPYNFDLQMAVHMHDAVEAYVGDIPTPLKVLLPEFQLIEEQVHSLIVEKFSLAGIYREPIKRVDLAMFKAEKLILFGNDDEWSKGFNDIEDAEITISIYSPSTARRLFLEKFNELDTARNK